MSVYAHVVGDSEVNLWGLSSRERLRRQIAELPETELANDVQSLPPGAQLLCVRAQYLFETRTLKALLTYRSALLRCVADGGFAAGIGPVEEAGSLISALSGEATDREFAIVEPVALAAYEDQLRKAEEPLLLPMSAGSKAELEDRLYGRSYKGITDLVTKWFWPRPAKRAVRMCARLGITPNMVTMTGVMLVVYSAYAFYRGDYWPGLVAGWAMTFLDTVDGKLARVTVRSSRFGHLLDHGVDILHPPLWYVLWGMSLTGPLLGFTVTELSGWIVAAYAGGRFIEGAFYGLGECTLFDWRPFDAYFRLVTARRNTCLIILSAGMLAGSPEGAFLAVVVWTVATTGVLLVRLMQGTVARLADGPLRSWLADPASAAASFPQAFRYFSRTRGAYGGVER